MLFTLGVTALWSATEIVSGPALPVAAFSLTGYATVLLWRNCVGVCGGAVAMNAALLYHRQVKVIDIILARILLEIAGATVSFIALSVLFISIGWMRPPAYPGEVLLAWILFSWFSAGLAMTIGLATSMNSLLKNLWHPVTYLMFPLSGAAFMVEWMSPGMQRIALYIPMVHGTEWLRAGYFGDAVRTSFDALYFISWCMALTLSGLFMARHVGAKAEAL